MDCSNGGREAMKAAQRYPTDFVAIVAGNSGFRLAYAGIGEAWDSQQFMRVSPAKAQGEKIVANSFSRSDLDLVSHAVAAQCDAKDGLKDPHQRVGTFRFSAEHGAMQGRTDGKLPAEKVDVLKSVFDGAKNSRGETVYATWPWDAGINTAGWIVWKLGTSQAAQPNAINYTLGASSLTDYFMTPPTPGFNVLKFDFDRDVEKVRQAAAIDNADATFLTTFAQRAES